MATTHAIRNDVLVGWIISVVGHIRIKCFFLFFTKVEIGEAQCD
jgi:hypothetical protein